MAITDVCVQVTGYVPRTGTLYLYAHSEACEDPGRKVAEGLAYALDNASCSDDPRSTFSYVFSTLVGGDPKGWIVSTTPSAARMQIHIDCVSQMIRVSQPFDDTPARLESFADFATSVAM